MSILGSGKKNVKTTPSKILTSPTYPIHFVANTFTRLIDAHNVKWTLFNILCQWTIFK